MISSFKPQTAKKAGVMQNSIKLKATLLISGSIAVGIGAGILFAPEAFYAANNIQLAHDINLLSEIRAPGGALLACGVLIISGSFVPWLAFSATLVSSLMYISYGLSRILAMAIDGIPAQSLIIVCVLEMAIGLFNLCMLIKIPKSP